PSAEVVIGRESELAAIEELLQGLATGPGTLLIEGEAGIGKTTLWNEAMRSAEDRGYRALSSRAAPSETPVACGGLVCLFGAGRDRVGPRVRRSERRSGWPAAFGAALAGRDHSVAGPTSRSDAGPGPRRRDRPCVRREPAVRPRDRAGRRRREGRSGRGRGAS